MIIPSHFTIQFCLYVVQFASGLTSKVKLRTPPRTDKSRWMAYAINILLVWLLQNHLVLSTTELEGAMEVGRFTVFVYFDCWFRSPFIVDAAYLDLRTFNLLHQYQK